MIEEWLLGDKELHTSCTEVVLRSSRERLKMADGARQGRSAVCFGDPDAFASEMIQMINQKEYRSVLMKCLFKCIVSFLVMLGLQ